jgi:hypothetical protein
MPFMAWVGVDLDCVEFGGLLARERIEFVDRLDLVAEHRDPPAAILVVCREEFNRVPPYPEGAAGEACLVAPVLERHEVCEQLVAREMLAGLDAEGHRRVGLDRADAVDA